MFVKGATGIFAQMNIINNIKKISTERKVPRYARVHLLTEWQIFILIQPVNFKSESLTGAPSLTLSVWTSDSPNCDHLVPPASSGSQSAWQLFNLGRFIDAQTQRVGRIQV